VSFAQDVLAGAAAPPAVTVQVQASIPVALRSGVDLGTAKTQITARLDSVFTSLAPGASVTAGAVLTALRDDAKYAVDAARMQVTLQTDREFIQVAQGGQAFTVAAGQTFTLAAVDVTASGPEQ
jgi:Cu/Ag efflux pump CusA